MIKPINSSSEILNDDTRALVVGLGRSGMAAVKLIKKMGVEVVATDSRSAGKLDRDFLAWAGDHDVVLECGTHSDKLFANANLIVLSPGVPIDLPLLCEARERGVAVVGEMALAVQLVSMPIVAITGTNGKSTVTELIGDMFRMAGRSVFVGGNLGSPLSEYLLAPYPVDIFVLEVSSFQLDTAPAFRPDVGILLNISPDHLDRYVDYEHYAESKFSLFAAQKQLDIAIFNGDDCQITDRLARRDFSGRAVYFGSNCPAGFPCARIEGQDIVVAGDFTQGEERYSLAASKLGGEPNLHNVAAAIMAARMLACPATGIMKAIAGFKPLAHRLEKIAEVAGVLYLDDSKATNTGALAAALAGMERPVVLIAGGRDKGGDYRLLCGVVRDKVKAMILIGEARDKMAAVFTGVTRVEMADDMPQAVDMAAARAENGDVVLLSPACASFDMFDSYGHRGQVFKEAVLALPARLKADPCCYSQGLV